MSGICGLFNLNDAPVVESDIRAMAAMLAKRGPDRTSTSLDRHVGLGHTLLATTPELVFERQPFGHPETGCVITADVRLDNRDELLAALGLREQHESTGDAELILATYLAFGEQCLDRLLGDFAFAIWDPRREKIFCARDHSGVRPLYYHHAPGKRFVFASDARSILVLPQVPYQVSMGRVADFLVPELEWIDYTSTFFEGVSRLPPGHFATVTPEGLTVAEYWKPHPGPDPGPMSDEDYKHGLLEVLTTAVEARLRTPPGLAGSMLSGGMDSGSVVAIGKDILRARGDEPLRTYSGVQYRDSDCAESQAIYAAMTMEPISPTLVHPDTLGRDTTKWIANLEEPFDGQFTILKAIYLAAQEQGQCVVLDGAGGDVVLSEGSYIARLIRQGKIGLAIDEIRGENRFWGIGSMASGLLGHSRGILLPETVKKHLRGPMYRQRTRGYIKASLISREFANSVGIEGRFERMRAMSSSGWTPDYALERCNAIRPSITGGRERYARLAASAAIEASDPFLDKRVVDYCTMLPGQARLKNGWPKMILRELMADRLPDEVRWCREKPHIGWLFNDVMSRGAMKRGQLTLASLRTALQGLVDDAALNKAWRTFHDGGDAEFVHTAYVLSVWLAENETRPVVAD